MSPIRTLERTAPTRTRQRNLVDGCDLVAEVHSRSLRDLEQLARAERARAIGNLFAAAYRTLTTAIAGAVRESRLQLAADALTYRARRPTSR